MVPGHDHGPGQDKVVGHEGEKEAAEEPLAAAQPAAEVDQASEVGRPDDGEGRQQQPAAVAEVVAHGGENSLPMQDVEGAPARLRHSEEFEKGGRVGQQDRGVEVQAQIGPLVGVDQLPGPGEL